MEAAERLQQIVMHDEGHNGQAGFVEDDSCWVHNARRSDLEIYLCLHDEADRYC